MLEGENNFSLKSEELNWKEFWRELRNWKKIVGKEKKQSFSKKRRKNAVFAQKILSCFFSFYIFSFSFFLSLDIILILILILTKI